MIKLWFRTSFNFFTTYWPKGDLTSLNAGFADLEQPDGIYVRDVIEKFDRLRLQLYTYLVQDFGGIESMAGKSLLETGCGRGGGLHYIASKMTPEYSVGVDISDSQVGTLIFLKFPKIDTLLREPLVVRQDYEAALYQIR